MWPNFMVLGGPGPDLWPLKLLPLILLPGPSTSTRKIVTRRDASIEKINKIWAVHFRP